MSQLVRPLCALFVALVVAACGREPGAVPVQGAPSQAERSEMKKQLESELRAELTRELEPSIREKVERQLRSEMKAEVRAELAGRGDSPQPTRVATNVMPPTAAPDAADSPGDDAEPEPSETEAFWSKPGTFIRPWRGGVKLLEVAVGTGLEDKVPTGVQLAYDKVPELLYCYSVFENPAPGTTITHVWRRGTCLVSRVELEVGNSPKWKTWSKQRTQAHWTGTWSCEVLGPEGQQLGGTAFVVGAP